MTNNTKNINRSIRLRCNSVIWADSTAPKAQWLSCLAR